MFFVIKPRLAGLFYIPRTGLTGKVRKVITSELLFRLKALYAGPEKVRCALRQDFLKAGRFVFYCPSKGNTDHFAHEGKLVWVLKGEEPPRSPKEQVVDREGEFLDVRTLADDLSCSPSRKVGQEQEFDLLSPSLSTTRTSREVKVELR